MEVEVLWEGTWYHSTLLEVSPDGASCGARFWEGGDEEFGIDVASRVRRPGPPWVKKGLRVEAEWDGDWYTARVLFASPTGRTATVRFDEGGDVESDVYVSSRLRPLEGAEQEYLASRVKLEDLEVGQKLRGSVCSVRDFGIFVDVGAQQDGLVPKARASERFVEDLGEIASLGDEVDTWVSRLGRGGKLELTMVESKVRRRQQGRKKKEKQDVSGFLGVPASEWLTGRVDGFSRHGVFVEVQPPGGGPPAKGLVHASQIRADGFVHINMRSVVSACGRAVGDELQVRVEAADQEKGKLDLTLLPLPEEAPSAAPPRERPLPPPQF